MIIDARSLPDSTNIDTDACIVGGGVAGMAIAREFIGQPLRVCLFRREGAYARFKALLDSKGALDRWYAYGTESIEQALRAWCAENGLELSESLCSPG